MKDAAHIARIRLLDSTLRDGSHAIRHRYTPEQVELIAGRLDEAGVHSIGVGHGDGLGASSIQYMRSLHTDEELLVAARRVIKRARLAVTFQPGIGTKSQLRRGPSSAPTSSGSRRTAQRRTSRSNTSASRASLAWTCTGT